MKNFADRLTAHIRRCQNPVVMGLDPMPEKMPVEFLEKYRTPFQTPVENLTEAIWQYNRCLIDAVADIVPAIKPQLAYYEMYGENGWRAFVKTTEYAREKGMLIIADAKRNDIGSTSDAYAKAFLGETPLYEVDDTYIPRALVDADALTVNAYTGIDGIQPFLKVCAERGKGIFILVRTSNPSAGDLQDLELSDGRHVYDAVAQKVHEWGATLVGESGYSSVGAVVGATWPQQAEALRRNMPRTPILVPGYGAQGGSADTAAVNFDADGGGAIVNASRSLMYAYQTRSDIHPMDFAVATRDEALRMREDLLQAIDRKNHKGQMGTAQHGNGGSPS